MNFNVASSRTVHRTSGRRVVHHDFSARYSCGGNLDSRRAHSRVHLVVRRLRLGRRSHTPMGPTHTCTRHLVGQSISGRVPTIVTFRLGSKEVVANEASSLVSTYSSTVLGTVGTLTGVSSSVLLLSPIVLRPVGGLGDSNLRGHVPALATGRVLVTLSVSTIAGPATRLTCSGLSRLGSIRTRSAIVLGGSSSRVLQGLNLSVAYSPICPSRGLCCMW